MTHKITCPECKWRVDPGLFCENCGAELPANEAQSAESADDDAETGSHKIAEENVSSQPAENHEGSPASDFQRLAEIEAKAAATGTEKTSDGSEKQGISEPKAERKQKDEVQQNAQEATPSANGTSGYSRITADSECPDVEVELDESVILAEGMHSTFRFRITNKGDKIESVKLELTTKDPTSGRLKSNTTKLPGRSRIQPDRQERAFISFKPDFVGLQPFRYRISFRRNGQKYAYETNDTVHTVYQQNAEPGQVINQVINNIENKGHAADVPVNNTVDFYRGMESYNSMNQIIEKAKDAPSTWIPLPLYEDEADHGTGVKQIVPSTSPPATARTERISLKTSSFRIHLLTAETVSLGRKRVTGNGTLANDIVARNFINGDWERGQTGNRISRHHCHIRKKKDTVEAVDQGITPEGKLRRNVWGTFIDGTRIPEGEARELPPNDQFSLSLAGADSSTPGAFTLRCRIMGCELWNKPNQCPSPGTCNKNTPAAMIMHRFDELNEIFIILWGHVQLGIADQGLGKIGVIRYKEAFAMYTEDAAFWLEPGRNVKLAGDEKIEVLEQYCQCQMTPSSQG